MAINKRSMPTATPAQGGKPQGKQGGRAAKKDAAGKGSSIRRLTEAMDARLYRVIPIAAPTDEEKAHHYLWRFWRHLPRAGRVRIMELVMRGMTGARHGEGTIGRGRPA